MWVALKTSWPLLLQTNCFGRKMYEDEQDILSDLWRFEITVFCTVKENLTQILNFLSSASRWKSEGCTTATEYTYFQTFYVLYSFLNVMLIQQHSVAQTVQCRMTGWLMNNTLERMWMKGLLAEFKILFRHLLQRLKEGTKKLISCPVSELGTFSVQSRSAYHSAAPPDFIRYILKI
jgi:hypothetical protein